MSAATSPTLDEIRDYLLRRMAENDRARFEEAYFKSDELLDRVEIEEDRLVSDYVLGRLSESDRHRFEQSLMGSPYYKERVETTTRLKLHLSQHHTMKRRVPQTDGTRLFPGRSGMFVVVALLSLLLVATLIAALHLRSELAKARQAAIKEEPTSSITVRRAPASPPVVIVLDPISPATAPKATALLLVVRKQLLPPGNGPLRWVIRANGPGSRIEESGQEDSVPGDLGAVLSGGLAAGRVQVEVTVDRDGKSTVTTGALDVS